MLRTYVAWSATPIQVCEVGRGCDVTFRSDLSVCRGLLRFRCMIASWSHGWSARGGFTQVYQMVDEFYLAGEVQETSKQVVMARMAELETLD